MEEWIRLDWQQTNAVLSRQMKVSGEWARAIRKMLGKPRSTIHAPRASFLRKMEQLKSRVPTLRGLTRKEAEKRLGYKLPAYCAARKFLDAEGVLGKAILKHPWPLMNFALGDTCLSHIWKVQPWLISNDRWGHRRGAPQWPGHQYKPGKPGFLNSKFQQALATERAKARRWRIARKNSSRTNESAAIS